ncbi:MAG: hypothetical protein PHN44_03695 [Candidatus Marinimicrobia bacterium]|jgi:hypothetical protein|nr:hypothetical protein [Candidatus Neomarinimicrobiota bacterium]MDD5539320.1 hypothetical protein [Candidatus Neomarinimicrobiota bacterium]
MSKKEYLIDSATVEQFRTFCGRFCRACINSRREHGIPGSMADMLATKEERALSCPIIRFEAFRRLNAMGGVDAVSCLHTQMTEQIMDEIGMEQATMRTGRNV